MPWLRNVDEGSHVVLARLAYYLSVQAKKRRAVLLTVITKSTLTRYINYHAVLECRGDASKDYGPRRLDVFLRLVEALGHSPSQVLEAAIVSTSAEHMDYLIAERLTASSRVSSAKTPGEGLGSVAA